MAGDPGLAARLDAVLARAAAQVEELTRTFDAVVEVSALDAADDEHDPDGATVAFERAQVAALLDAARAHLAAVVAARARVDAGTFGRCTVCGGPIAAERLAALPAAETCISCAA